MTAATAGTDRCPRCGGAFDCGAAAPEPCACAAVVLSAELQAQLRDRFQGCLCLACLHSLAQAESGAKPADARGRSATDGD